MEMRLIDANMMAVEECKAYLSDLNSGKIKPDTQGERYAIHWKIQQLIANTPTVDLETLPIVRQLRKELATIKDILGDTYDLDRLRELMEADKAGRCVALAVKPGDKVRPKRVPYMDPEVVDCVTIYTGGRITYGFHRFGVRNEAFDRWDEEEAEAYILDTSSITNVVGESVVHCEDCQKRGLSLCPIPLNDDMDYCSKGRQK